MSGKYYSFTYAPNKVDLTLDLPTTPPKKSSSSTVQKASSSTGTSSSKQSSSTTSSSSGSKDPGSGSTKVVTLTKK